MILQKLINSLGKTDDFLKMINSLSKTNDFIIMINLYSKKMFCKNDGFA